MTKGEARLRTAARVLADLVLQQERELAELPDDEEAAWVEVDPKRWTRMVGLAADIRNTRSITTTKETR